MSSCPFVRPGVRRKPYPSFRTSSTPAPRSWSLSDARLASSSEYEVGAPCGNSALQIGFKSDGPQFVHRLCAELPQLGLPVGLRKFGVGRDLLQSVKPVAFGGAGPSAPSGSSPACRACMGAGRRIQLGFLLNLPCVPDLGRKAVVPQSGSHSGRS